MQDTIFALATGSATSAVAVIRVSGPRAADVGRRFTRADLKPREARYSRIWDPLDGELIDSGLVLYFPGPASFTGEDCVEFQVHGSRAVIARLLDALSHERANRIAQPGEFIRRAFDHGKLALTSVEGIADLIDARTDQQRRQALMQAGGALASRAQQWREQLLDSLALVTAEIDFADEGESPTGVAEEVGRNLTALVADFRGALLDARRGEVVKSGFRVALCGPPNAGKSSLLNALARRDVAIVTEHAGTTRDVIEVELDLDGFSVVLSDTAGLRETSDAVESIGIERSRRAMETADLVLWLSDSTAPVLDGAPDECLVVATKADVTGGAVPDWSHVSVSALTGLGIEELVSLVSARASAAGGGEPPLLTNARQHACLESAARHAERLVADDVRELEFLADGLLLCADCLQALVGRIGTEEVLGAVFSRFCMGK